MPIDPRLVGGAPYTLPELPTQPKAPQPAPLTVEQAAETTPRVGPDFARGEAIRQSWDREKATVVESAGAAASLWGIGYIADVFTKPKFDPAPAGTYDSAAMLSQLDFVPTDEQRKVLLGTRSAEEFSWHGDKMRTARIAQEAMSDNPGTAFLVSAVDPTYLGIDILAPGVGRAVTSGARSGRAVTAGVAGVGSVAVGMAEQSVVGKSTSDLITEAIVNAGAATLFYNPVSRKLEDKTPDYPSKQIVELAQATEVQHQYRPKLDAEGNQITKNGKPVYEAVRRDTPEAKLELSSIADESTRINLRAPKVTDDAVNAPVVNAGSALRNIVDDAGVGPVAKGLLERAGNVLDQIEVRVMPRNMLDDGHEFYHTKEKYIALADDSPAWVVTHEVAHAVLSDKIEFGLANLNTKHGEIVKELRDIMNRARIQSAMMDDADKFTKYYTDDIQEFVAGLFSGDSQFVQMLARMPDKSTGSSMLTTFVDAVRRMLGMLPSETSALTRALQLSDELIDTAEVAVDGAGVLRLNAPTGDVAAEIGKRMDKFSAESVGNKLAWSLSKSLGQYSDKAKELARKFWDDPIDMTADSVESQKRAIRADLTEYQKNFEDAVLEVMASRGAGLRNRVFQPRKSKEIEMNLLKDVATELARRSDASRKGLPISYSGVNADVKRVADLHDSMMKYALKELKSAGVEGADAIEEATGYFRRQWSVTAMDDLLGKLKSVDGLDDKSAMRRLKSMVATAAQRANGWDTELASDIAGAIVDRTFRKGYGQDQAFLSNFGKMTAQQVRDVLTEGGLGGARLERAMEIITGSIDEAGKQPMLKHRIDLDLQVALQHGDGTTTRLIDLWDMNLTRQAEHYLDVTAAQAAFARKGFKTSTDIAQARTEYLKSIPNEVQRKEAEKLWDNAMAQLQGQPVGEDMHRFWRMSQAVNQAITLGFSGLWQVTEFGNLLGKYGLVKTTKAMFKSLDGSRQLYDEVGNSVDSAKHLVGLLERNSTQDVRLRPYVQRLEDNFDIPTSDAAQLGLSQVQQLVPHINAMKYVMNYQARVTANLVVDVFDRGVRGDARAIKELEKYGFKPHLLEQIKPDITKSLNAADWSDGTWMAIRGPLTKMMDESVLRARSGEIPAFVQHTSAGKVLFTYRNFVLASHNKVLAGTLGRDGYKGVALIAAYQFPLTMMATAAHNTINGKKAMEPEELVTKSIGQMGVMGLLSEVWGIASGDKTRVNIPATIPFDRMYNIGGDVAKGNYGSAALGMVESVPLLGIAPGIRMLDSQE